MILTRDSTLFEGYCGAKKDADHAEGGESEERNHKDGHKIPPDWNSGPSPLGEAVTVITRFCEVQIPILVTVRRRFNDRLQKILVRLLKLIAAPRRAGCAEYKFKEKARLCGSR
jgi:hypothetical protein